MAFHHTASKSWHGGLRSILIMLFLHCTSGAIFPQSITTNTVMHDHLGTESGQTLWSNSCTSRIDHVILQTLASRMAEKQEAEKMGEYS